MASVNKSRIQIHLIFVAQYWNIIHKIDDTKNINIAEISRSS